MSWSPWQPIVRREVWHGRPWVAPVFVLSDDPGLLVKHGPWWDPTWAEWEPPADLSPPPLPEGWERVPPA